MTVCSQDFTVAVFISCLFLGMLVFSKSNAAQLDSVQTWSLQNIPLLCLKKVLGCFRGMIQVIIHLRSGATSNEF